MICQHAPLSRNFAARERDERLPVVLEYHQTCISLVIATASCSWPDELFPISTVSCVVKPCQTPEEGIKIAVIGLFIEFHDFISSAQTPACTVAPNYFNTVMDCDLC